MLARIKKSTKTHLSVFLWLIAAHSFIVGVNLMLFPSHLMEIFGFYRISENFFKVQGGVFHLVMTVAYAFAAVNPLRNQILIVFAITAKIMATIFLLLYYTFVNPIAVVLLSGIADLGVGLVLWVLYRRFKLQASPIDLK